MKNTQMIIISYSQERRLNMLLLCYPKCSTCKKALKYLDDHHLSYEYRDIKTDNPDYEELKKWHELSHLEIKRFFNTSGNLYKSMNLKDIIPNNTLEDNLKLLSGDGMLVKRPILIDGDTVLVGFKEDEWKAHFIL